MEGASRSRNSSTSQSQSQGLGQDIEDLKQDIPYFDDPPPPIDTDLLVLGKSECPLDDLGWDRDADVDADAPRLDNRNRMQPIDLDEDNYPDENESSALGSDYAPSGSGSGANSFYQSPTPSGAGSGCDVMLRPPSTSVYHFNYRSPGSPLPVGGASGGGPGGAGGGSNPGRMHPFAHSPVHGAPPPGFYPNMWYPNAPYGSGSSAAGGSIAGGGGRFMSYGGSNAGVVPGSAGMAGGYPGHSGHLHALHHQYPQPHPHPHSHGHPHAHHPQHPHHQPHPHHQHPHETMMEMFQLSNNGREARNRAEKNRRDKLNGSIQELSTMVPHVAESPRRVDKTAVLRFAAHALRLKHAFGNSLMHQRPQITDTLMNMLDSFFLALTCHGHILLISSSIEQHLGHCQTDLYGQSIMQITHPDDQNMLKQQLIPTELENLFDAHGDSNADPDADGEPRQRSKSEEDYIDRKLREDRRSFRVRLARAGPRSEPTAYEVVKIDGCFRRSDEAPRGVRSNTFSSNLQLIRRTRGRDDVIPLHTISGNDIILTACARIIRPPKIASRLIDANTLEYRTRHLIDGRIIDCDQRIGIVAGYMTEEVRNLSPFTFMHNDDVRWVIVALRQMYDCNSSYGESTYRLFTRNGNIIYLQSKGYLEIDKETNKVHSFVCVNTLLSEEEGKRRVQEMKKKFSVIINTQIPQSTVDVPASEHPALLEKAVLRLIQNLQKTGEEGGHEEADEDEELEGDDDDEEDDEDADDGARSASEFGDPHGSGATHHHPHHAHHVRSHHSSATSTSTSHGQGSSKTPPLALVPPETASVKSSISKSISVVNVTAAKHLRGVHGSAAKSPSSQGTGCTCSESHSPCDFCQGPLTPDPQAIGSTLKRSGSALAESEEKVAKRRFIPSTEIEHVLHTSLNQIGRNLTQQLNVARNLREQGQRYDLPHANQRFDEIMQEHQKQSELYVNIKSEYEVQLQNKASTRKSSESDRDRNQNQNQNQNQDQQQLQDEDLN
ncbi:uncharacterized protein LOC108094642 [Drosophila ficusphila]|uniref:uncharacterized protein LOC108094642 n=1 Tax=Drosophila ficusphila TaxID=30025 RepID=UPI0007E8069B|nr:uncharacterized protein LOC108094642 [Drosophila ficusphila]XP_043063321.1 uncharacterized protein LOC108094642 [Drosophila ficusphila]